MPVPINRHVYDIYASPIIDSEESLSDITRVLIIVLYRLELIQIDTAHRYVSLTWPLEKFGCQWFEKYKNKIKETK